MSRKVFLNYKIINYILYQRCLFIRQEAEIIVMDTDIPKNLMRRMIVSSFHSNTTQPWMKGWRLSEFTMSTISWYL